MDKCLTSVRAIIKKKDRYLLVQRKDFAKHNPNFWEFPGGKTDCKEPKGAIKRELREELGVKLSKVKFIKEKPDGRFRVRYYRGNIKGKMKLQEAEVDGVGWFTRNQARKLNLVKHTRRWI